MIRLLATDVDYTLYDSKRKGISERNIEAIKKLQDKGVYVVLASSRVLTGMKTIIDLLDLEKPLEYIVANNGAEIYEVKDYFKCKNISFSIKDIISFVELAKEYQVNFSVCQDDYSLVTGVDKFLEFDFFDVGVDLYWVHDIVSKIERPIYRCAFTGNESKISNLSKEMEKRFSGKYYFNMPIPGSLDVSKFGVSKASGVLEIANVLGISKDEIACIGDGDNDIPMFNIAKISACVGNGSDKAKTSATYVVDTCENDGFAQFVENYIL